MLVIDPTPLPCMVLRRVLLSNVQAATSLGRVCMCCRVGGGQWPVAAPSLDPTCRGENRTTAAHVPANGS